MLLGRSRILRAECRQDGRQCLVAADRSSHHDPATCPICQYLSQARLTAERFEAAPVPAVVSSRIAPSPLILAKSGHQAYIARAPPAV